MTHGYGRQHAFLWNNYRNISFRTIGIRCAAVLKCVTKLINTTVALICLRCELFLCRLFSIEHLHTELHFDAQAARNSHKNACKLTEKLISVLIRFWCVCLCIWASVIFSPYLSRLVLDGDIRRERKREIER